MIVFLAGPIEFWWDSNWHTPKHLHYIAWREQLSDLLVHRGHLVYRPHHAFKGAWETNGGAQAVNNKALELADLVLVSNYDPPVRCHGTDAEVEYVDARCRAHLERLVVPDERDAPTAVLPALLIRTLDALEQRGVLVPVPAALEATTLAWEDPDR